MKKLVFLLALCLFLSACANTRPPATEPGSSTPTTEVSTQAPTQVTITAPAGPQPMDLVGTWKFLYTEIEGEQVYEGNSILTVQGAAPDELTVTYRDPNFPGEDFADKALSLEQEPVFPGCGNEQWRMAVDLMGAVGNTRYTLTLLPDGKLMLQFRFTVEDMPMVSYQFFTKE